MQSGWVLHVQYSTSCQTGCMFVEGRARLGSPPILLRLTTLEQLLFVAAVKWVGHQQAASSLFTGATTPQHTPFSRAGLTPTTPNQEAYVQHVPSICTCRTPSLQKTRPV